jgi:hypothetical protein
MSPQNWTSIVGNIRSVALCIFIMLFTFPLFAIAIILSAHSVSGGFKHCIGWGTLPAWICLEKTLEKPGLTTYPKSAPLPKPAVRASPDTLQNTYQNPPPPPVATPGFLPPPVGGVLPVPSSPLPPLSPRPRR